MATLLRLIIWCDVVNRFSTATRSDAAPRRRTRSGADSIGSRWVIVKHGLFMYTPGGACTLCDVTSRDIDRREKDFMEDVLDGRRISIESREDVDDSDRSGAWFLGSAVCGHKRNTPLCSDREKIRS